MMKNNILEKFEGVYLTIFKIGLIFALSGALISSVGFLIVGLEKSTATVKQPDPAKKSENPKINATSFVEEVKPAPQQKTAEGNTSNNLRSKSKPNSPSADPFDEITRNHILALWPHVENYQKLCAINPPIDRQTFVNAIPKEILKEWYRVYGEDFAQSQNIFVKDVLSNPSIIAMCKESNGQAEILLRSIDWHKNEWEKQIEEGRQFELDEENRVTKFTITEYERVHNEKQGSKENFMFALYAFGVFMSLAFLLIFTRIEYNLRTLKAGTSRE